MSSRQVNGSPSSLQFTCAGLAAALCGLAAALVPAPAHADPSFDCARASVPAEFAICETPALAKLDQQIADIYFALLESVRPTLSAQIRHQQRAHLRERNACAADESETAQLVACIDERMRLRLGELQILHAEISGAPVVTGGEFVTGSGISWRAAVATDIPADAVRLTNGGVLCAVGLPDVPVVGTIGDGGEGCQIARDGAAFVDPAFSVLIADESRLAWSPVRTVNAGTGNWHRRLAR